MKRFIYIGFVLLSYLGLKAQSYARLDSISKLQWLRINVQGALIANNSFSNLNFKFLYPETAGKLYDSDYGYTNNKNKPVCFGFNAGIEFLIGRKPKFKQLVSFTYDLTNSKYNYNVFYNEAMSHSPNQTWNETISRQVQFISLNYGFLFNLTKKLKLATIASLAFYTKKIDITNGYYVEAMASQRGNPPSYDSTNYNNSKTVNKGLNLIPSLKLRASYDVTKYLSVFVSRNFGVNYKAPWWMVGLQFYPFRKLR